MWIVENLPGPPGFEEGVDRAGGDVEVQAIDHDRSSLPKAHRALGSSSIGPRLSISADTSGERSAFSCFVSGNASNTSSTHRIGAWLSWF